MATAMTHLRFDGANLWCVNDTGHRVTVLRADGDKLIAFCRDECWSYDKPPIDTIASLAWYDDHANLSVLVNWLGDMSPHGFRSVVEKPWNWEDEFKVAQAVAEHEQATEHVVWRAGSSDRAAYCNEENCDWRIDADTDPEPDVDRQPFDMSGATPGAER